MCQSGSKEKLSLSESDETNFCGRDRDRVIVVYKLLYKTETEKQWSINYCTRPRINGGKLLYETETETCLTSKLCTRQDRGRESRPFWSRDRDETETLVTH